MEGKLYGVIMAGGGGTRFWPLSRRCKPKQLLNLSGREILINEAIDRLTRVVDKNDMFVVTSESHAACLIKATKGRLKNANVFVEPSSRNTAACIGYAALKLVKKYGDGVMAITPSDAAIRDVDTFAEVLKEAAETAESTDKLVTVGITPTFPATGYGYIHYRKNSRSAVKKVESFVEKPDLKLAKKYVSHGSYAWNSGMFVWKASVILKKIEQLLPDIYGKLRDIADVFDTDEEERVLREVYPTIRSISIDYGVLERCPEDILCIPAEFGWSDVGSWDMLNVLHEEDGDGNIALGNVVAVNTKNSVMYSASGKLIAAVDVEGMVIVETKDAILICPKDRAQDVKKIVDELHEKGMEELL